MKKKILTVSNDNEHINFEASRRAEYLTQHIDFTKGQVDKGLLDNEVGRMVKAQYPEKQSRVLIEGFFTQINGRTFSQAVKETNFRRSLGTRRSRSRERGKER